MGPGRGDAAGRTLAPPSRATPAGAGTRKPPGTRPRGRRRRLELGPCLDPGTRELRRPGPSGRRALPAAGPLQRRERGLRVCVPATQEFRAPAAQVLAACGRSKPLRDSESPALSSAATIALHRAAPPGNGGWEEWTNLRKRGLKKKRMCYDTETVARLQLRPAPLGIPGRALLRP